jgi:hypothetical protein
MMLRIIAVTIAMAIALGVSLVLRRRRPDAPTQANYQMPSQLDRGDFASAPAPWLVVVFTSATCGTCEDVANKAAVLASRDVAVMRVDYTEQPDIHLRYNIQAVPTLVVADENGVVRAGFMGPVKAQDLWAAVAECREPGSSPEPELGRPS